jgi:hypothetical protein
MAILRMLKRSHIVDNFNVAIHSSTDRTPCNGIEL